MTLNITVAIIVFCTYFSLVEKAGRNCLKIEHKIHLTYKFPLMRYAERHEIIIIQKVNTIIEIQHSNDFSYPKSTQVIFNTILTTEALIKDTA